MTEMYETHEDCDRALTRFFQDQLPKSWPAAPLVQETQPKSTSDTPWSSRLALAASIAVLLGLGLSFGSHSTQGGKGVGNSPILSGATADGSGLLEKAKAKPANAGKATGPAPRNMP